MYQPSYAWDGRTSFHTPNLQATYYNGSPTMNSANFQQTLTPPKQSVQKTGDEEAPPPIPQRQMSMSSYHQYSPYTTGGYPGLYGSSFPNYMYGANTMNGTLGLNNSSSNEFEIASQTAFQTAQTFIGAFTSVSMMLESTLFAVQNSIRAITSVADQFGHLRNHIIYSTSAFLRALRYYLNKVLTLLKLRKVEKDETKYWLDAVSSGMDDYQNSQRYASLLFFCVLIATPWFVWKLLRSLSSSQRSWEKGTGSHFVAEVKFPFTARKNDELTIAPNTIIRLAPKHHQPNIRGWLLASDGEKQGLIPANYIKILGKNRDRKDEASVSWCSKPDKEILENIFKEEEKNAAISS